MPHFKIFQPVIKYELVGEVNANSEDEAIELLQNSKYGPGRIEVIKKLHGSQKDETGSLIEFGELVARKSKWR